MASSGSCELAHLGEICLITMALGAQSPAVFIAGKKQASGNASWKRCNNRLMRMGKSTGRNTRSIARRFEPISMRLRQKRVLGDKAYSSRKIRQYLKRRGIGYTIPRRSNETRTGPFNRALYKERNYVERLINRLKQFRRVATRYEKRAVNFLAMVTLASIMLWL